MEENANKLHFVVAYNFVIHSHIVIFLILKIQRVFLLYGQKG